MSGRQTKVINEQAERYALAFGGRTIHLPKVVRNLHDFLAANWQTYGQNLIIWALCFFPDFRPITM